MTAWRRLRAWQQAGVWEQLHELLIAELHAADQLEWEQAIADSSHLQPKKGAKTAPSPVDRRRRGSNHHLLVEGGGVPLPSTLTGGNRNDVAHCSSCSTGCRRSAAESGAHGADRRADRRPRLRPRQAPPPRLAARRQTRDRSPQSEYGSGLGRDRWVVERTFAWLHNRRRLLVRTDRRDDIHEGLLALACCLICRRRLKAS